MRETIKSKIIFLYNKGAIHIILGTFLSKFVAFFGSVFIVRILSKSDYGVLSYVENLFSYTLLFAGLGLSNSMLRYETLANNDIERNVYHKYISRFSTLFNVLIIIAFMAVNMMIAYPQEFSSARYWMPIILISLPFQNLVDNELFVLRGFFKTKLYAFMSCMLSIFIILSRIVGAKAFGIGGTIWSRGFIYVLFTIILYGYNYTIFFREKTTYKLERNIKKEIFTFGLQNMITSGLWVLLMLNDSFMLSHLTNNPDILAEYKVASVLPANVSIFATAIGVFVSPYFTKNEKNNYWIRKNFKKVFCVNIAIIGSVVIVLAILARPLINLMYGEKYANIVGLMRILLMSSFFNSGLRYIVANILAAMGKAKENMLISAAGAIMLVVLDYIFIPQYSSYGVAIANCIVYLSIGIVLFYRFYKQYYINDRG